MDKTCNICFIKKDVSEFYSNAGCKDGYQNRCKECTKQKSREQLLLINSDPILKAQEQERHRKKYHNLGYKEKHKPTQEMKNQAIGLYKKNYPEKYKAKILSQRIPKEIKSNELHHWNYNADFGKDIIELKKKEHSKAHRFMIYDQEYFMYRRIDTMELLNTKQKHYNYIIDCINNKPD